ncbi:hypothetical protein BGZ75_004565 [Mortierella antarctica]|nr:hypothetical protein BGZ67_005114 [Mortierella alpina]KAF9983876.1 hypothetical protein BGZ75_004565 [Mortierella antarctica]
MSERSTAFFPAQSVLVKQRLGAVSTCRQIAHYGHLSRASLPTGQFVDSTPAPAEAAHPEIGATSAPLKSAALLLGSYCRDYNEDFMLCKNENSHPAHCLKDGRKFTRCAMDLITELKENCKKEWEARFPPKVELTDTTGFVV